MCLMWREIRRAHLNDRTFQVTIVWYKTSKWIELLYRFSYRKHGEKKQTATLPPSKVPVKYRSSDLINCEWCSEVFVTISKAIEHKFRKHRYESTNYFCKVCGKLFPLKVKSSGYEHPTNFTNTNLYFRWHWSNILMLSIKDRNRSQNQMRTIARSCANIVPSLFPR